MTDPDLPDYLLTLIRTSLPSLESAELLVFLAAHPGEPWSSGELVNAMRPTVVSVAAVTEYLGLFKARGLVNETDGTFYFDASSEESKQAVQALVVAFNERPVTLIRNIYTLADPKLQSFADSFKFKKD